MARIKKVGRPIKVLPAGSDSMANSTTSRSKVADNPVAMPRKLPGQVGDLKTAQKAIKKQAKGDRGKFIENRFGNVPL